MNTRFHPNCFARHGGINALLERCSSRVGRHEKQDRDNLGSARLQRAGRRILRRRTFSKIRIALRKSRTLQKSSRTPVAITSTPEACAPRKIRVHAKVSFLENQPASTISSTDKQSRYAPACGKLYSRKFAICFTPISMGVNGLMFTGACGSRVCPYS